MNTDNNTLRINELIAELSECRQDERNTQDRIIQVISVAGTVLGILLGASSFAKGRSDSLAETAGNNARVMDNFFTYPRILFLFSFVIFVTAFAYVLVLGVHNILRYYYIQNLEDQLHKLSPGVTDSDKEGPFVHWNAFLAPIITRNPRHIKSYYTVDSVSLL